jgi:hypothetical protein
MVVTSLAFDPSIQVENNSKASFSSISLQLRRSVVLRAHGTTLNVDQEVSNMTYPGIKAFTSFVGHEARQLQVRLPPALMPTTRGQIIEVSERFDLP